MIQRLGIYPNANREPLLHREGWLKWSVRTSGPLPRSKMEATRAQIEPRIREIAQRVGATIVDPADWLCSKDWCPAIDGAGRSLYKDQNHLRAMTARDLVQGLDNFVYLSVPPTHDER